MKKLLFLALAAGGVILLRRRAAPAGDLQPFSPPTPAAPVPPAPRPAEDEPPAPEPAAAEDPTPVAEPEPADEPPASAPRGDAFGGPGSAPPNADGSAPEGFAIKGNAGSNLFHTPESPYYKRTKAEVWFRTVEDAQAAGFTAWDAKRKR